MRKRERPAGRRYLVLSFQSHRINLADVVGFRGGVVVISILNEIAPAVVSEVGHSVVEEGNCPEKKPFQDIYVKGRYASSNTFVRKLLVACLSHAVYALQIKTNTGNSKDLW